MSCTNCYGGCTQIVSDQCVRYTGIDVPILGIQNGDSLSVVEQSLITFLTSVLDGTGIKPNIPNEIICSLVQGYLPVCEDLSEVDLIKALIQSACDLQTQITTQKGRIDTIEAPYTLSCVTGVAPTDGTHAVLQAVITKLCSVDTALTALTLNVSTNYVALADLNTLIQAYLDSIVPGTQQYLKMVPYTILPYFGSLSHFDITGAGTGDWIKIYLCNGNNGTPDLRGRVPVGAIVGVGGGALAPAVNPGSSAFNPNYALGDTVYGTNSVTLITNQLPSHLHSITDVTHTHLTVYDNGNPTGQVGVSPTNTAPIVRTNDNGATTAYSIQGPIGGSAPNTCITSANYTGITSTNNSGGNLGHDNKQPALAVYFIMYIP